MNEKAVEIVVTYPSKELALTAGKEAVRLQLAACAQIGGEITSIYRWEGNVQTEVEYQLRLKTTIASQVTLVDWLAKNHPYQVPEILFNTIEGTTPEYLEWIVSSTGMEAQGEKEQ